MLYLSGCTPADENGTTDPQTQGAETTEGGSFTEEESTETCTDREGTGVITTSSRTEDLRPGEGGSFSSEETTETCDECNGTGEVER